MKKVIVMNETKVEILKKAREPITIKDLHEQTGIKWANLSKHISELRDKGFIVELGKDGKSKVIQTNKYVVSKHIAEEIDSYQTIQKELIL